MGLALACAALGCVALDERDLENEEGPLTPFGAGGSTLDAATNDPADPRDDDNELGVLRGEPEAIDFGPVSLGVDVSAALTLFNDGAPLDAVAQAHIEGENAGDFRLKQNYCVSPLGSGQSCQVELGLTATRPGPRTASLVVESGSAAALRIPLSANGLEPGNFAIEPLNGTSTDFGSVKVAESSEARVRVTNNASDPSGVLAFTLSGEDFSLIATSGVAGGCISGVTALEIGQSCELGIAFRPIQRGQRFATLTVASASQGASVGLRGRGLGPAALVVTPPEIEYGSVVRGGAAQNWLQLSNQGDEASGVLSWALSGVNADSFAWDASGCPDFLPPLGACPVRLDFTPVAAGAHSASLDISANPGGATSAAAAGEGLSPGSLSITAEAGSSEDFGGVLQGAFVDRSFVIGNTGTLPSGAFTINVQGTGFSVLPNGTCQSGVTELAGGQSCTVQVRFQAGLLRGPLTGTLSVASSSGGNSLGLSAQALALASLTAQGSTQRDFGAAEVNQDGSSFEWVLQNSGDVASDVPVVTPSSNDYRIANGCTAPVPPGGTCSITVTFTPRAAGVRGGSVSARANGRDSSLFMTGSGQVRLTVTFAGTGTGQITSQPAGLSCTGSAGCTALFSVSPVVLSARSSNGSDSLFGGWSEPACPGPMRECSASLTASRTITATFNRVTNNIAFVTSQAFAPNLGSVAPYDARCNSAATAAGINNATNDGYLAFMSTSTTLATARFGANVQGWVRMDGRPFISTFTNAFTQRVIHHPVTFDENGAVADYYMTGTSFTNQLGTNCEDWTSNRMPTVEVASYANIGSSFGGPDAWMDTAVGWCNETMPVLCLGRTKTAALAVPRATTGKRIWVTSTPFVPGSMTPDAKCQAERPAGVVTASALIALTNRAASAVLDPAASYRRMDDLLVGTGAQLVAKQPLTGIWLTASGQSTPSYISRIWSGASSMSAVGTAAQTCNNWTATTETSNGNVGFFHSGGESFWGAGDIPCSHGVDPFEDRNPHLYCVER